MIAQSRAENRIDLKIAIKNKGERDSTFRQSKDASGSLSVCGEIGQSGIEGHRAVCIALDSGCRRKELPRLSVLLPLFRLLMDKGKTGHEACPGKGGAPLENGDRKGNVGIT